MACERRDVREAEEQGHRKVSDDPSQPQPLYSPFLLKRDPAKSVYLVIISSMHVLRAWQGLYLLLRVLKRLRWAQGTEHLFAGPSQTWPTYCECLMSRMHRSSRRVFNILGEMLFPLRLLAALQVSRIGE